MSFKSIPPPASISLFVKSIWTFADEKVSGETRLPFFADGYPGLMLQKTTTGLQVNPHKKLMPVFFLYGQTIQPIELQMSGPYELIAFQLYPFVLKNFFDVPPQSINDNCYDLALIKDPDISSFIRNVSKFKNIEDKLTSISSLLTDVFQIKRQTLDYKVRQVLEEIIQSKGQNDIRVIAVRLKINPRTLERRFLSETGITAKQFAKIIQFQLSLQQLNVKNYNQLSDIVYENGYADQSHFIKVFKAFTGKTPKAFSNSGF